MGNIATLWDINDPDFKSQIDIPLKHSHWYPVDLDALWIQDPPNLQGTESQGSNSTSQYLEK